MVVGIASRRVARRKGGGFEEVRGQRVAEVRTLNFGYLEEKERHTVQRERERESDRVMEGSCKVSRSVGKQS